MGPYNILGLIRIQTNTLKVFPRDFLKKLILKKKEQKTTAGKKIFNKLSSIQRDNGMQLTLCILMDFFFWFDIAYWF